MFKTFFNRWQWFSLGLVLLGPLAAGGWWWWHSRQGDINFLPRQAPAEWIIFPAKLSLGIHDVAGLSTTFRKTVHLDKPPARASLAVAGCRRCTVAVNGVEIGGTTWTNRGWQRPDRYDIQSRLQAGDNRIVVVVAHSNGPPALWLALRADEVTVNSDATWEAAYAGDANSADEGWRPVQLADVPRVEAVGAELGRERPWPSLGERWPTLLFFMLMSALLVWWLEVKAWGDSRWLMLGLGVLWLALFFNNFGALPSGTGYDAKAHLAYIGYIQEHRALPLAGDGWEMFQPPLYYLVAAVWLKLMGLSANSFAGVTGLRVLGLGIGIGHVWIVWRSLRRLFPEQKMRQRWGLVVAGLTPVLLYLSEYVTNEALAGALMSGSVYAGLRLLGRREPTFKAYAVLGLWVGLALLTKATALLLLPAVFGALAWRQVERREVSWGRWAGRAGLALAVCGLVCGWHYGRTWWHYGTPLIGNWDVRTGNAWWQDNGFQTGGFFLRFGRALSHPWFSSLSSFWDGLYTTFWGDSVYAGATASMVRPPWNYDLMAMGYVLALLPTALIVVGLVLAVGRFIRRPSAEWFMLLGLVFLMMLALARYSLDFPFYGSVKACFGLGALIPVCAFGGWGLEYVGRGGRVLRLALCVGLGVCGINGYAAFWVRQTSVAGLVGRGQVLIEQRRYEAAIDLLQKALPAEPGNTRILNNLGYALFSTGKYAEAIELFKRVIQSNPKNAEAWKYLGVTLAAQGQFSEAKIGLQKAILFNPEDAEVRYDLAGVLVEVGKLDEAILQYREVVRLAPDNVDARLGLGQLLVRQGRVVEAIEHFQKLLQHKPDAAKAHEYLGLALASQGRFGEAETQLCDAIRRDPANVNIHHSLGKLLALQRKFAEAAEEYRLFLQLQPDHAAAHCNLGSTLVELGRREEAIGQFREALRLEPNNEPAREQLRILGVPVSE